MVFTSRILLCFVLVTVFSHTAECSVSFCAAQKVRIRATDSDEGKSRSDKAASDRMMMMMMMTIVMSVELVATEERAERENVIKQNHHIVNCCLGF